MAQRSRSDTEEHFYIVVFEVGGTPSIGMCVMTPTDSNVCGGTASESIDCDWMQSNLIVFGGTPRTLRRTVGRQKERTRSSRSWLWVGVAVKTKWSSFRKNGFALGSVTS